MRFAFLTELYAPSVGGQEVFFQELGEAMVRRGHTVDVYCIGHVAGLPDLEVVNGVTVHRKANSGRYKAPRIKALRRNWSDISRYSAQIRRVVARGGHDFYLLNEWPLMHVLALPGKVRPRSALHWCEIREDPLLRTLQAQFPKLVGSNFAVSEAVAAVITRQSGRECGVLPSGIEAARYRVAPGDERSGALYVGRLAPHKNLPLLIDGFALAAERGFVGDLVIAGDGPSRADVEAYARRSPAGARVRVLGSVDEAQKIGLLSTSSVLGMPSRREGFPRVIAEAMASGLPVVTADFSENGAKDVVKQYGAGVICGTEPENFADALLAVQAGWDGYSWAGLAGAANLDWSHIAEKLEKHAERTVEGSKAR
ncbi:glycosyltransferase family 4 protein [Mycolicibacterium psychrotolerans]|uniref:Glycosyl transferase family 1 n=1 Tax=Mycolicibacterium psychrotolerans TaxID=216929 RepID=A0A7I7MGU4_9MYCO|nr:glycosyltransferase family 4 protein [Mycolicibacterium psychrotolerans]BBX71561.1 glycosyl transferase family 1 [Mycolicibacterium psychrotolerans]